jgi:prepilin-type N-terminal cleavage/methylation domain-containing protein
LQSRIGSTFNLQPSTFNLRNAFTLVEVLVVMTLLSLIVLSLMTVLNSTQTAFRAGITQAGVLESGRAVSDLIKSDLEGMTPSLCPSNVIVYGSDSNNVNFYATNNLGYTPLVQSLPGGTQTRTYVLENFFILSSANVNGNPSWVGTGYVISTNLADGTLYPLYRFSMSTNVISGNPAQLFNSFYSNVVNNTFTNWSHLMDGVVELRVRAYDPNGLWMTNTYPSSSGPITTTNNNVHFYWQWYGETCFSMYSNTLPASVEVELGVLEDRALQRAESLPYAPSKPFNDPANAVQSNYLAHCAGQVHVFRQRVWIRNVDPAAYK